MRNRLGIYYAFLASSDTVDWIHSFERTKAAGLDLLEMSAPKLRGLSSAAREEIAACAKDLMIGITFATALSPNTDVSDPSPKVRAAGIKRLIDDLKMLSRINGTVMGGIVTGVGKNFPLGIEHTRMEAMERAAMALRDVAKAAEDLQVDLGIEVVNRFESPLVNTCVDGLKVAEFVDSPRVGVHLDTFHMNIEEADIGCAIRLAGKRLIHFHACENNRALPGQAHMDWWEIFAALGAIGYDGPIVMEALPGPYGSLAGRMNIWRQLAAEPDQELAAATRFLYKRMAEYGDV